MAGSTEVARALVLAAAVLELSGCVTGHLLDRARRREYLASVSEAWIDGDRLVIGFEAKVTDDDGREVGRAARWAAVSLGDLASTTMPRVDHLWTRPRAGRAVAVWDGVGAAPAPPLLRVGADAAGDVRLAYEAPADPGALAAQALTDVRTVPWVYPLIPLTLAIDLVTTPPLALMAPAVLVFGD